MILTKKLKFHLTTLGFVAAIIVFAYWQLPHTFFQQDEWQGFGIGIYYQSKGVAGIINSMVPVASLSHFNPFSAVFFWFEFFFFYTNFIPYAWLSIVLQIINTCLLYCFVLILAKNRKVATISALLYAVSSISSQAVTWVAAANSFEITSAFILLSLISFQKFLTENSNRKYLFFSLLTLFISLLFHEVGIFLFLFYPILISLRTKAKDKRLLFVKCFAVLLFAFLIIRLPFFFIKTTTLPAITDISSPPVSVYPYRLISISMKSFADSFFPEKTLIGFSDQVIRLAYPQFVATDNAPNPYVSQLIVFDLVSYILTFFILFFLFLIWKLIKEKEIREILVFSTIFVPLSLLPYAFVLGKAGYSSILTSEYFYVCSIGTSIILAIVAYTLLEKFSKRKIIKVTIYLVLFTYISSNISSIRVYVNNLVQASVLSKTFLVTIKSSYHKLPKNVIFYAQSDKAYYGMPDNEHTLPTEIGFGQMLMVWYQKDEKFPGCFYKDEFLLDILTQGYIECNGRGFGYFRDYDKLENAVLVNHIPVENVISYSWQGKTEQFTDITTQVREKLRTDLLYGVKK